MGISSPRQFENTSHDTQKRQGLPTRLPGAPCLCLLLVYHTILTRCKQECILSTNEIPHICFLLSLPYTSHKMKRRPLWKFFQACRSRKRSCCVPSLDSSHVS